MRGPLLLATLLATTALAAPKPKVVVDAPPPINALLTRALKKKFTPVPPKSDIPDEPTSKAVKQAVREAGAVALVTARLSGGSWDVIALNGLDGAPLEQLKFKAAPAKKPLKALPKGTDKRLEKALARAKAPAKEKKEEPKKEEPAAADAPAKEEPKEAPRKVAKTTREPTPAPAPVEPEQPEAKGEEAPPPAAPPVAAADDTSARPTALTVGIGFKLFSRRFYYNQDLFSVLSKYALKLGPALQFEADWYPAAHFTRGVPAHLGVSLGFAYAVGINSVATDGTRYPTTALRLRAALQGRLPISILELTPHFGVAIQSYSISGATKPNIPDVSYTNLRVGLGARVSLVGPLGLFLGFAYQAPMSTGEIGTATYFPRLKAGGLDANYGLVIGPLFKRLEIKVGGDYIRYWYAMNPEPGDTYIAGGALDDYVGGTLLLSFVL